MRAQPHQGGAFHGVLARALRSLPFSSLPYVGSKLRMRTLFSAFHGAWANLFMPALAGNFLTSRWSSGEHQGSGCWVNSFYGRPTMSHVDGSDLSTVRYPIAPNRRAIEKVTGVVKIPTM